MFHTNARGGATMDIFHCDTTDFADNSLSLHHPPIELSYDASGEQNDYMNATHL